MPLPRKILFAAVVMAGVGGLAYAQAPDTHTMTVQLPDGSLQKIEYTGNVPPRIEIVPVSQLTPAQLQATESPFAMLQRMSAQMDAQMAQMFRGFGPMMMMPPPGGAPVTAAFGGMPAAGSGICFHSVQVTYNGTGQPKVVSQTSGDCGGAAKPRAPVALPAAPVPPTTDLKTIKVLDQHPAGQPAYRALVIPASDNTRG
jgi:hypothetical protein